MDPRPPLVAPYPLLYESLLRRALEEDLGRAGDLTTDAIVDEGRIASGAIVTRRGGRIAGLQIALRTFELLDPRVETEVRVRDGCDAASGEVLARLRGPARPLLSAERTALNLLGRLCGIATSTRDLVAAVRPYGTSVACTRKTTAGLRSLEKYAVRAGGGVNHRFGLDDAVLVKDNHRIVAGGIRPALERVRRAVGHMVKVEVEVDTLEQLDEALAAGADVLLLDNMPLEVLAEAVERARGRAITEASGGITLESAAKVASTGVDIVSVGWITHSAPQLDVALDLDGQAG